MAVAFNKFNQFIENLGKGVHNFTSDATCSVTVALCAAANAPIAGNSTLGDLTVISYTNLSSRVVTGITWEQTGGTAHMTGDDLTLTASGDVAAFQYAVLYDDDSASDSLIGWYDYGSEVTLHLNETFKIDLNTDILTAA